MNALRFHSAHVTTYVDALAASIASVIAMAGDEIVMMPGSQMMIHEAHGFARGDAALMREAAELMDKQSQNIASLYASQRGGTAASWRDLMKAETWFTADEAVDAGLADSVHDGDAPEDKLSAAQWDLSAFNYAGREHAPPPAVQLIKNSAEGIENAVAGPHSTSVVEGAWSRSAQEGKLPTPVPLAKAKRFYTSWDEESVADGAIPKSAGHLPHHQVSSDGNPGAAIRAGVVAAKARANQVKGGESEKAAVLHHLRGHVPDSDHSETEDALLAEFGYVNKIDPAGNASNNTEGDEDDNDFSLDATAMRDAIVAAEKTTFEMDAETFHAVMKDVANDAPAPPQPKTETKEKDDEDMDIDLTGLKNIIRKVAKK